MHIQMIIHTLTFTKPRFTPCLLLNSFKQPVIINNVLGLFISIKGLDKGFVSDESVSLKKMNQKNMNICIMLL